MPKIELEVSPAVLRKWRRFLNTSTAGRLDESGLLGDWVLQAFMVEVERYLKEGLPEKRRESSYQEREGRAADARKKLSKRQKRVLNMFNENENQTKAEMSRLLGVMPEEGEALVDRWVEIGFLAEGPKRNGMESYVLSPTWQEHQLMANRPSLNAPRAPHILDAGRKTKK